MVDGIDRVIKISEVFDRMNEKVDGIAPKPFTISYYSYNVEKKKGGKLIRVERAVRCGLPERLNAKENFLIGIRPEGAEHDVTIHWPFIEDFNGKRVMF